MKHIIITTLAILLGISAFSQQNMYKWRIGIHGGIGNYYGDLSTGRVIDPQSGLLKFWDNPENLSYGLSIERSLGSAWSIRLMSTRGVFQANDRATKWNGNPYDSEKYARALNFRTSYFDVDGIFIYHFDNGKFFKEKSRIAPYFGIGVGYMNFNTKGDLYLEDGSRYHYWSDNTIRDVSENDPNAPNANIVEQDGIFETDLRSLQTEGKSYSNSSLTFPLALGIKFRLNNRINLNLETLLHYAMTDYLDDVSGDYFSDLGNPQQNYASNPSNFPGTTRGGGNKVNDIYGVFNLSIGYNFGYKKQGFRAPVFYLGNAPSAESSPAATTPTGTTLTPATNTSPVIPAPSTGGTSTEVIVDDKGKTTIIRDTVYQIGTVIKETVIIKTDTIREEVIRVEGSMENKTTVIPVEGTGSTEDRSISLVDEIAMESSPLDSDIDTLINIDPITMKEDTFVYAGEFLIEIVPDEPVFSIDSLADTELDDIDTEFFEENIGYLKDDLSEKEKALAKVQESNFELVALRNEINEIKAKKEKDQGDIDKLYSKLDEMSVEQAKLEAYRESLLSNAAGMSEEDLSIQRAADQLEAELAAVRADIIYLQSPDSPIIDPIEYERIKKENEARLSALEEDMRKLRKNVRKSKRKDAPPRPPRVNNPSRLKDKDGEGAKEESTPTPTVPETIIVEKNNPAAELAYQLQIQSLQKDLTKMQELQNESEAIKKAEIDLLNLKLQELERKLEITPSTPSTDDADSKVLEYIISLEKKLDDMNKKLVATESKLEELNNRPAPKANTTIITQPTKPQQLITEVSPAKLAIDRIGIVNIYYNTGKSNIKTEFYGQLDRIVSLMNQYPSITTRLTGFTDKSGNPDANFRLSKKRSDNVANYLMSRGISQGRIITSYMGDSSASSNNDPFSRRVEIRLQTY